MRVILYVSVLDAGYAASAIAVFSVVVGCQ